MTMTHEQKALIRESFDRVRDMAGPLALLFYGKLFELDRGARRLFHNDIRLQGLKLMDMLGSLIDALDRFDSMEGKLSDLGRRHAGFGVRPEQYDTLKTALLWRLAQALGPDFDEKTRAAWALLIESVNQTMKAAPVA